MYNQQSSMKPSFFENVPLIDGEFDSFELNSELELQLREVETANFFHDALDIVE